MECRHDKIMCRNCVKICLICGAELPQDFGTDKNKGKDGTPEKAAETPKKATRKKGVK